VKIGAKLPPTARHIIFQTAEVDVRRDQAFRVNTRVRR
jgi:hypothetical protein